MLILISSNGFAHGDHHHHEGEEERVHELYSQILHELENADIKLKMSDIKDDFFTYVPLKDHNGEVLGYVKEAPLRQMVRYYHKILFEEMKSHCHHEHGCDVNALKKYADNFHNAENFPDKIWKGFLWTTGSVGYQSKKIFGTLIHSLDHAMWASYKQFIKYRVLAGVFILGWEILEHVTPLGKIFNKFPICKPINTVLIALSNPVQLGLSMLGTKAPLDGNLIDRITHRFKTMWTLWYYKIKLNKHELNIIKQHNKNLAKRPPYVAQKLYPLMSFMPGGVVAQLGANKLLQDAQIFFKSFDFENENHKRFYLWEEAKKPTYSLYNEIDFLFKSESLADRFWVLERHISVLYHLVDLLETYFEEIRHEQIISNAQYASYLLKISKVSNQIGSYRRQLTLLTMYPQSSDNAESLKQNLHTLLTSLDDLSHKTELDKMKEEKIRRDEKINQKWLSRNCTNFFRKAQNVLRNL